MSAELKQGQRGVGSAESLQGYYGPRTKDLVEYWKRWGMVLDNETGMPIPGARRDVRWMEFYELDGIPALRWGE